MPRGHQKTRGERAPCLRYVCVGIMSWVRPQGGKAEEGAGYGDFGGGGDDYGDNDEAAQLARVEQVGGGSVAQEAHAVPRCGSYLTSRVPAPAAVTVRVSVAVNRSWRSEKFRCSRRSQPG